LAFHNPLTKKPPNLRAHRRRKTVTGQPKRRAAAETDSPTGKIATFTSSAQRFALPACGRAWTRFGNRKNPKPEKCSKMPQNPTRQVHPEHGRAPILNEKNQGAAHSACVRGLVL